MNFQTLWRSPYFLIVEVFTFTLTWLFRLAWRWRFFSQSKSFHIPQQKIFWNDAVMFIRSTFFTFQSFARCETCLNRGLNELLIKSQVAVSEFLKIVRIFHEFSGFVLIFKTELADWSKNWLNWDFRKQIQISRWPNQPIKILVNKVWILKSAESFSNSR